MACNISRPDPQTLFDKHKDMFSNQVLHGSPIIPESNEWYVVSLNYALAEEFYAISEQQWRERDPRFASYAALVSMAAIDGVFPRPAGYAQGYIRVTGTPNAALTQDMEFVFGSQHYVPASTVPARLSESGFAVIRVKAIEPGPAGNIPSTVNTGTMVQPLPGVNQTVTVYGGQFCGGTEAEGCNEFRERYLRRLQYRPNANLEWIKEKALEWPCATDVCERGEACCEVDTNGNLLCPDTIQLYVLFNDTFPCGIAPQCVIDELNAWLFGVPQGLGTGQVPFGICGSIIAVKPACLDIFIDGLACITASQQREIEDRIREFIRVLCPSQHLLARQIETVIAQVLGDATNFDVILRKAIDIVDDEMCGSTNDGLTINACGDAEVECDYKICLNNIKFVNSELSIGGCL